MPSLSHAVGVLLALLALATPQLGTAYSYSMRLPSGSSPIVAGSVKPPNQNNQLLMQSPSLDNVYMDYLVTSKPLNLRKYNKSGGKIKKTKKDSKIYFIPIPPLPYRYIPGFGYDYQPMKIRPIMPETTSSTTPAPRPTTVKHRLSQPTTATPSTAQPAQNKLLRVQHHKDYYFNGRPFRLQVAHADRKSALTPHNLKSKFYYNKHIIY
ncbi:uncharacterized protein LOC6567781 [Drosophila grimshawi]|uniref:GH13355 n=1 Tax=Drosophila grimshawi TaxID=7222 RepID=B4JRB8_DROGR|nr:uncharacterized protein LOC6567781 [Drosophila grimshawi]EDV91561.1 GH13355 [Drosophila grimshawi]EDV94308.1 GH20395 [Drosophila grimshawi]